MTHSLDPNPEKHLHFV